MPARCAITVALSSISPTHSNGLCRSQPAQLGKSVDLRRVVQHIAAERRDQALPVHERRQRQEDEAAFRTVAAPVGSAALGRLAERGVAAAEHREIVPRGARSGARWQPRTAAAARRNTARPSTTCRSSNRLNACSNSNDLLYWWFTSATLGALAECSFDIAIASNPWMIAQASTIMLRMPVIGTCPFSAPASFSANSAGSSLRVTRIAGSPACAIVASIGAALPS